MEKDFDGWNRKKKFIQRYSHSRFCYAREVWWCSIGVNIGFEEDGKGEYSHRPVLVVRGFNERIFFGVALTGSKKEGKYYFPLGVIEDREASVILSQVRLIDTKRLVRKICTIDTHLFERIKEALQQTLFG